MLKMNQRWISCKGSWMTIMNEKVIMVLEIIYLGHYVKTKELQKAYRVWIWMRPLHIGVMKWHFELWIC